MAVVWEHRAVAVGVRHDRLELEWDYRRWLLRLLLLVLSLDVVHCVCVVLLYLLRPLPIHTPVSSRRKWEVDPRS